jgi:hypothetical protein
VILDKKDVKAKRGCEFGNTETTVAKTHNRKGYTNEQLKHTKANRRKETDTHPASATAKE